MKKDIFGKNFKIGKKRVKLTDDDIIKINIFEDTMIRLVDLIKESRIDVLQKKYSNINSDIFNNLVSIDPTPNKKYLDWVLRLYSKNIYNTNKEGIFFEDSYKLTEYLELYSRLYKNFTYTDINQYKAFESFNADAIKIKNTLNSDDLNVGKTKSDKYEKFKLGEIDGFDVYEIPKGRTDLYKMSCDLGTGTEWCTSTGKTDSHFLKYINQDSLYIFIKGKVKYQFSFHEDQYMNSDDFSIFDDNFTTIELIKSFFNFLKKQVKRKPSIKYQILMGNIQHINYNGNLDYSGYKKISLPDHLTVNGTLDLSYSKIKSLPKKLTVKYNLDLSETDIQNIPDDLYVGTLKISNTKIISIPDTIHIANNIAVDYDQMVLFNKLGYGKKYKLVMRKF